MSTSEIKTKVGKRTYGEIREVVSAAQLDVGEDADKAIVAICCMKELERRKKEENARYAILESDSGFADLCKVVETVWKDTLEDYYTYDRSPSVIAERVIECVDYTGEIPSPDWEDICEIASESCDEDLD
jgi:hypothetical protein